jgi:protein-S-isoprenylcysteine O-methyltransferase Ste14
MYVALTTIYVGVSVLGDSGWSMLLLPVPVAIMHWITIPMEERNMEATFGSRYRDYAARVRRWL